MSAVKGTSIVVAGEAIELFAARAVFRPRNRTLLVADPHFGKAAAFRAAGVFVPEATTAAGLARLDTLVDATKAERIVFLGDFLHAREGRHPDTLGSLAEWREQHSALEMTLVRGNHDACAGDPPDQLQIHCVNGPVAEPPFVYSHRPKPSPDGYVLAGHVHPAVFLSGAGRQRERLSCFWLARDVGVLPAFGEFTGLAEVSPAPEDRVWVIADDQLVEVRG
jgi:uncharacterized protein